MMLVAFVLIPAAGGVVAWITARWGSQWPRWISLFALTIDLILAVAFWAHHFGPLAVSFSGPWLAETNHTWITQLGIRFHLAIDSLSLLLIVLTAFLGIMSVLASWREIEERVGFFHFNLMWTLAAITGVFLALDLFLFYFFWEMMLIPMYLLIIIWGHENRVYAAVKFFLFTQASGLLMLAAILGLYFAHGHSTGTYTFDYVQLLGTAMSGRTAMWLMLGFVAAFAVKLPVVPLHTWLPDAHTEAPTAGSVILAGLLLKTGAYGLLRFVLPLFPNAALDFAPYAMGLGVVGIIYGAVLAFAQYDLKRLVAYTSVSHMGFVLLGIFAFNELAFQGAVMQIICHGIATGALFILVGELQERTHTRDIRKMEGLWATVPRMGAVALFFAIASLGLPGMGNFVGEFLVLLGAYQARLVFAILASLGLIAATIYALWIVQTTFHGPNTAGWKLPDLRPREMVIMGALMAVILWLGLYPQSVISTAKQSLDNLPQIATTSQTVPAPPADATGPGGDFQPNLLFGDGR